MRGLSFVKDSFKVRLSIKEGNHGLSFPLFFFLCDPYSCFMAADSTKVITGSIGMNLTGWTLDSSSAKEVPLDQESESSEVRILTEPRSMICQDFP